MQHAQDIIIDYLGRGRITFPIDEVASLLGGYDSARRALYRLVKKGWVFSPQRDFFVIIDPQHRGRGYLPVEWFIDPWMRWTDARYYLGGLTAAMLHGAAHQKPQQVQVIADQYRPALRRDGYQIVFFYKKQIEASAFERRQSPVGYYQVSTPAMTAYDLLRYPPACPSPDIAATIYCELGEKIDAAELAALPAQGGEIAVLQRVGWLFDHCGWAEKTAALHAVLAPLRRNWQPLWRQLPPDGMRDTRWRVLVNVDIEADV